jgi:hypothetical protein
VSNVFLPISASTESASEVSNVACSTSIQSLADFTGPLLVRRHSFGAENPVYASEVFPAAVVHPASKAFTTAVAAFLSPGYASVYEQRPAGEPHPLHAAPFLYSRSEWKRAPSSTPSRHYQHPTDVFTRVVIESRQQFAPANFFGNHLHSSRLYARIVFHKQRQPASHHARCYNLHPPRLHAGVNLEQ